MKTISPIIRLISTEKSSIAQSSGKYAFKVNTDATKIDVKNTIRKMYGAEVSSVKTMLVHPKKRLLRGKYEWSKRPVFKKAIVTLKDKKTIDIAKLKESKDKK